MAKVCNLRLFFGIILLLILVFSVSGCNDSLGIIDLSGEIMLSREHNSWAYRNVTRDSFSYSDIDISSCMARYLNELNLQGGINLANEEYSLAAGFKAKTDSTGSFLLDLLLETGDKTIVEGFKTTMVNFATNQKVELTTINESESGDDWNTRFFKENGKNVSRQLERTGEYIYSYREPKTGLTYRIETTYRMNSSVVRSVDKDNKLKYKDGYPVYDETKVSGSARIDIGLQQRLAGVKGIDKQKIKFYVLDWDLDGKFTEVDVVWCDHVEEFLNFNSVIRLSKSWNSSKDNKYKLSLVTPKTEEDPYKLRIDLVEQGVRKK